MITKDQMCLFCNPYRQSIEKPWTDSLGCSWAMDGRSIIRTIHPVPGVDIVICHELQKKMEFSLPWDCFGNSEVAFEDLPQTDNIKRETCSRCRGIGRLSICPECDGEGEIYYHNDYHQYDFECKTCRGDGSFPSCSTNTESAHICGGCKGTGKDNDKPVPWMNAFVNLKYIEIIKQLPGAKLSISYVSADMYAFRFTGGCGFVMAMKP